MPFVNIKILEGHSVERKQQMVAEITKSIAHIAQVPESYVQVVIEDIPRQNWGSGGELMSNKK
jgi:4-oxalocrotonate tautomerase family enzyme